MEGWYENIRAMEEYDILKGNVWSQNSSIWSNGNTVYQLLLNIMGMIYTTVEMNQKT